MKRILAIVMAVVLCASFSGVIYADDQNASAVSDNAYKAVIQRIDAEVRALPCVSDGISSISRAEMDNAINDAFSQNGLTRRSYSTTVTVANILAAHDGVSYSSIATIMVIGATVANEANSYGAEKDAFRHSSWNFQATKSLGASTTKIYTTNYEWANELYDEWEDYYDERYDYYYDAYYSSIMMGTIDTSVIDNLARADADDYICGYKDSLQEACIDYYYMFTGTFNNDNIMDWWNNKTGRDYGINYPSYTSAQMFSAACNAGLIILDKDDVTSSDYSTMWFSNWWTTN